MLSRTVNRMRRIALARPWTGTGRIDPVHRYVFPSLNDPAIVVSTLLTFDVGRHVSGWLLDSDHDKCWHLSLCGHEVDGNVLVKPVTLTDDEILYWAVEFFEDKVNLLWIERPASENDMYRTAPASPYTTHLRLFVDEDGHPIVPEGKVFRLKPYTDGSNPGETVRR